MLTGERLMARRSIITAIIAILFTCVGGAQGQTIEKDWTGFLHYASIGRLDMAVAHGKSLLASEPNATELVKLSDENPQAVPALLDMKNRSKNAELADLAGKILDIIEKGRYAKRSNTTVIAEEIDRLSGTARGRMTAAERLRNAGEYAVPSMLAALGDEARKDQIANIEYALEQMDKNATRPLVVGLQTKNAAVKAEIIRALGSIKDPQALPYLKLIIEQNDSPSLATMARNSMGEIDRTSVEVPAADLFVALGRSYYGHSDSLVPAADSNSANIWFWDADLGQLTRTAVATKYFNELMAMRCCEWALKADAQKGEAIGVWLAAYFKAESTKEPMPAYFGEGHAPAGVYATIAGPQYVQQALGMALASKNQYMALGLIEALSRTAGESSLLAATSAGQPLIKALYYEDRQVKYSAAIALASAQPKVAFADAMLVMQLLAEAMTAKAGSDWPQETADKYAAEALAAVNALATRGNKALDPALAQTALIAATKDARPGIVTGSLATLALLDGPDAQRAIAAVALSDANDAALKVTSFGDLATSARTRGNLLLNDTVEAIYTLVQSTQTDPAVRSAAAAAYGSLNLPSDRARKLLLDQAKD
jgi:hypothetical protein